VDATGPDDRYHLDHWILCRSVTLRGDLPEVAPNARGKTLALPEGRCFVSVFVSMATGEAPCVAELHFDVSVGQTEELTTSFRCIP